MGRNADVAVELAGPSDIDAVVECWLRLAAEQRDHGSSVRVDANRGPIRQVLAAHQVADGLLVARRDGAIVGFATVTLETETIATDTTRGLLSNIWVEPPHRDRGIGRRLLEAAESALAERGADVCRLEVLENNTDARRFYRTNGYEPTRRLVERPLDDRRKNDTHSKGDG